MQPDGQTGFTSALLNPDVSVPQNIVDPKGRIAPKRFAVYRNNVTVSLIEAVKSTFSAVAALVGDAFFDEMARQFVRHTPPQSPLIFEYGRDFPGFIEGFAPAARLPFLADVARLDRAWLDAFHAADAAPFAPTELAGVDEASLTEARFTACPATRLIPSAYPLVTIWQAARAGEQPRFADTPKAEWALVMRPDLDIGVVALSSATGGFFRALFDGDMLGAAAERAIAADPGFDFSHALGLVVSGGAFSGVNLPGEEVTKMLGYVFGRYKPIENRPLTQLVVFGLIMLALRLLLAQPFWASGQTRWVSFPFEVASSTTYLFENLFILHFGFFEMPIPFPAFTAYVTSVAEIVLPIVVVLGLLTRLGALALFAMSVVIQLVFPEAFVNAADLMNSHALWMAYGLLIAWFGPGVFSLDWLVRRFVFERPDLAKA